MTQEDITYGAVQTAEELGRLACARRKLLRLTQGAVVELDRSAGRWRWPSSSPAWTRAFCRSSIRARRQPRSDSS